MQIDSLAREILSSWHQKPQISNKMSKHAYCVSGGPVASGANRSEIITRTFAFLSDYFEIAKDFPSLPATARLHDPHLLHGAKINGCDGGEYRENAYLCQQLITLKATPP